MQRLLYCRLHSHVMLYFQHDGAIGRWWPPTITFRFTDRSIISDTNFNSAADIVKFSLQLHCNDVLVVSDIYPQRSPDSLPQSSVFSLLSGVCLILTLYNCPSCTLISLHKVTEDKGRGLTSFSKEDRPNSSKAELSRESKVTKPNLWWGDLDA